LSKLQLTLCGLACGLFINCAVASGQEPLSGQAYRLAERSYAAIAAGDLAAAERWVLEALQVQPDSLQLALLHFDILLRKQDILAATRVIQTLAVRYPDSALVHAQRGFLFQRQGSHQAALQDFLDALESPGLDAAQQRNVRLSAADSAMAIKQYKVALAVLEPYAGDNDPAVQRRVVVARAEHAMQSLNSAYRYLAEKQDAEAVQAFAEGFAVKEGTSGQYADAAYAAKRISEKEKAVEWFSAMLDRDTVLDDRTKFGYRRENEILSREYGAVASLAYQNGGFSPATSVQVLQGGAEFYWQPDNLLNRENTWLQVYGRIYENLYDGNGGQTGSVSAQGTVGVRVKPFSSSGVVFVAEKLIRIGSAAMDDWLLHVAYSAGAGGDMHPFDTDWRYWNLYADSAYFVNAQRFIQSVEVRYGHSWSVHDAKWIVTPHWVLSGDYDDAAQQPSAFGWGPGVSLRYWFREDAYRAPASWIDVTLQYRFELTQAARARGLSARAVLWY